MPTAIRDLDDCRPIYVLPREDLAGEVLVPGFANASKASCMVGFFASSALAELAPGLATYVRKTNATFRLLISPFLSAQDQEALKSATRSPDQIATDAMFRTLITEDDLQKHTLKCLAYLLIEGRIEIKIALMRNGLFHPKVWIFQTEKGLLAAHGSGNFTERALRANKEQVTVSKSWLDPTQRYIVEKLLAEFEDLWGEKDEDCEVLTLPEAVRRQVLRDYSSAEPPTEDDCRKLFRTIREEGATYDTPDLKLPSRQFAIPPWLKFEEGPYAHQGAAVHAWTTAGFRGTLEMATGAGKTLTSMIGAFRLWERHKPLMIVVAAPYVPLIEQWAGEIELFGLKPTNLTTVGGPEERARVLGQLRRRLRLGLSDVEIAIVSHDTLCTTAFAAELAAFECHRLLIADEAHNLGAAGFIANPPDFFESRLALSATPVRQYDPEGTSAIFEFFGPVVFEFTLKDAIGRCLVEYDYFVHPVSLSQVELDTWYDLSERLRKLAWKQNDEGTDAYVAKLLRERRLVLEGAAGKLATLSKLLDKEGPASLRHTLIYATDKAPEQLDAVNGLLNQKRILFHQLTAEETADRRKTADIIRAFREGHIQVLTAKRVLDEGVNIPQIRRAFILASTTVERQWVQRRGRLLRICPEIGKTHGVVHDLLALPPLDKRLDEESRKMVRSELQRAQEFASLARNAGMPEGALPVIHRLVSAALM